MVSGLVLVLEKLPFLRLKSEKLHAFNNLFPNSNRCCEPILGTVGQIDSVLYCAVVK